MKWIVDSDMKNIYIYFVTYSLREKCPNTEFFSGPYFPVFGLNTEIHLVNFRIQSEYSKIRTRKKSAFGHFLRSDPLYRFFLKNFYGSLKLITRSYT